MTETETSRLTEAASGGASREQFLHTLHQHPGLGYAWIDNFQVRATLVLQESPRQERTNDATGAASATALEAAASSAPRRYVITGGPSSGKDGLIEAVHATGIPCMAEEPGREIYPASPANNSTAICYAKIAATTR